MKKFKCPVDHVVYADFAALEDHFEEKHEEEAERLEKAGITLKQHLFNLRNWPDEPFRTHGKSIVSRKPTEWNEGSGRYARIRPEEKKAYRKMFERNMRRVHGSANPSPEDQRRMLAARRISGVFKWDAKHSFPHTGAYELDFLEHLRDALDWNPGDLLMPANVMPRYKDPETGKTRHYIPDAHIPSLGLLVEIKSGENTHYRKRDLRVEYAKDDAAAKLKGFRYIKILDKDYEDFDLLVQQLSEGRAT